MAVNSVKYRDALRGYAHDVLKRDNFACRSCGLDGRTWAYWLYLSCDHLLPKSHPQRNNPDFIVAACRYCHGACNRTVWDVAGKTPEQVVEQKKSHALAVREQYHAFWEQEVTQPPMKGGAQ